MVYPVTMSLQSQEQVRRFVHWLMLFSLLLTILSPAVDGSASTPFATTQSGALAVAFLVAAIVSVVSYLRLALDSGRPAIYVRSCFWPDKTKDEIMRQCATDAGAGSRKQTVRVPIPPRCARRPRGVLPRACGRQPQKPARLQVVRGLKEHAPVRGQLGHVALPVEEVDRDGLRLHALAVPVHRGGIGLQHPPGVPDEAGAHAAPGADLLPGLREHRRLRSVRRPEGEQRGRIQTLLVQCRRDAAHPGRRCGSNLQSHPLAFWSQCFGLLGSLCRCT